MDSPLKRTPLFDWHVAHGGRMVDFAGWSMPVQYSSIVTEHQATRTAATLFDVSHMARFRLDSDAEATAGAAFLDELVTRRVRDMKPGQVRYSLVTNDNGMVLDDILVYLLREESGRLYHQLVVNASNREKIATWIQSHLSADARVKFSDETESTAMIAVQGPKALALAQPLVEQELAAMRYYTATIAKIMGQPAIVSRTGYTGEDGCELIVPAGAAKALWETLLERGRNDGVIAAGLGARDTLRLEAGMPLYGHELTESIDPLEAGLSFAVQLPGRTFPGSEAIAKRSTSPLRQRVGLELNGKRAARQGNAILHGDKTVGEVTSGSFSPTLQKVIAMGFVPPSCAVVGTELQIDIRGQVESARVAKLPFYQRAKT